jgi:glycosyltransferase involved in cell wall biosynthesis
MMVAARLKSLIATPLALAWWGYVTARLRLVPKKAPSKENSVALISWDFPPNASTGAHLPASFARHAADSGWQVTVICGPGPEAPSAAGLEMAVSVPRNVRVRRVSRLIASEQRTHLYRAWVLPVVDGGYQTGLALALAAVDALADDPPAVVMASGPRFSNFVAARLVAEAFGARLLLQYRDEWTVHTPTFVDASGDDRREELACLARADVVSFVSDGKRDIYRAAFSRYARKFIVTPNGWEPHVLKQARNGTEHLPREFFTITYTGRCHVSLEPLLRCCRDLLANHPRLEGTLRLVFVGDQLPMNMPLMEEFERQHPGVLLVLPAVTPREAIEIQRESSALLLINDYMYEGIVPLKTFEYLCGTQPVLVFGLTGGAARIVDDTRSGISVAADDSAGFETAILAFMSGEQDWDSAERREWRKRNNRKVLVGEMLAAISATRGGDNDRPNGSEDWGETLGAEAAAGER